MRHRLIFSFVLAFACTQSSPFVVAGEPAVLTTSVTPQDVIFTGELRLPRIMRYGRLPMRMLDEVRLVPGSASVVLDPKIIPFMTKQLDPSVEPDLQFEAIKSLDRIARAKRGDISEAIPQLTALLKSNDRRVRRAAAMTLIIADAQSAAAELLALAESSDDRVKLLIEPTLATWLFQPAEQVWKERLADASNSPTSLTLAVEGLTLMGESGNAALLRSLLENVNAPYQSRYAAAAGLATLDASSAVEVGSKLADGTMADRLLAVATAATKAEPAIELLARLCDDEQNCVAARAWIQLAELEPDRLQDKIEVGVQHADSGVRLAAIKVMSSFPTAPHTDALGQLLGDIHIEVRNEARIVLLDYAKQSKELHDQIVSNAEVAIRSADSWQRTEQSLVIGAVLEQAQITEMCVRLLEHDRDEVAVTAAWFMHLFPNALVMDDVTRIADQRFELRTQGGQPNVDLQLAFLFQTAGFVEHKPMQPLAEKQFSKGSGLGRDGRSAAIWALGMMNRGNPDAALVEKLVGRMNDRNSQVPELDQVRRMAVMSLGRMNAKDQAAGIRTAYRVEVPPTAIPESARWALKQLGETDIPPVRPLADSERQMGGWNIYPIEKRERASGAK